MLVYHANEEVFRDTIMGDATVCRRLWQEHTNYTLVANVDTTDLDTAYRLTNHIDRDWTENEGVTLTGTRKVRSTSVGDVLVCPQGAYMVARCGFFHFAGV